MKKTTTILILLLLAATTAITAQVRPDQFPTKTNPSGSDEIYSQAAGTNPVRISFADAKKYFAAHVRATAITYTPAATGNTTDLTLFVKDPNNDIYYIDGDGNSVKIQDATGTQTLTLTDTYKIGISGGNIVYLSVADYYKLEIHDISTAGTTINVTGTLPTNKRSLTVSRNGLVQAYGIDYTETATGVEFTRALEIGERVRIFYPMF